LVDQEKFKVWLEKVCQRPLPNNSMSRIRTLAKELAQGAADEVWDNYIMTVPRMLLDPFEQKNKVEYLPSSPLINKYLEKRWNNDYPPLLLLESNGYLQTRGNNRSQLWLTPSAFQLVDEIEPANIFISYKRSESSSLALLVLARLKAEGIEPFLDMQLEPGEDWHNGLRERIQKYDYLIILLGKHTLKSDVVIKEIKWALEAGLTIIPMWHNNFIYQTGRWNIPSEIDAAFNKFHAIRVLEESALGYNNAIVELLNRFGITP
jgi:TIR domain